MKGKRVCQRILCVILALVLVGGSVSYTSLSTNAAANPTDLDHNDQMKLFKRVDPIMKYRFSSYGRGNLPYQLANVYFDLENKQRMHSEAVNHYYVQRAKNGGSGSNSYDASSTKRAAYCFEPDNPYIYAEGYNSSASNYATWYSVPAASYAPRLNAEQKDMLDYVMFAGVKEHGTNWAGQVATQLAIWMITTNNYKLTGTKLNSLLPTNGGTGIAPTAAVSKEARRLIDYGWDKINKIPSFIKENKTYKMDFNPAINNYEVIITDTKGVMTNESSWGKELIKYINATDGSAASGFAKLQATIDDTARWANGPGTPTYLKIVGDPGTTGRIIDIIVASAGKANTAYLFNTIANPGKRTYRYRQGVVTYKNFKSRISGTLRLVRGEDAPDPEIKTTAVDKTSHGKEIKAAENVTIVDRVEYKNLVPGQEYILDGILMIKETGTPLIINGDNVTASKTFTPVTADGVIEQEFSFDASAVPGRTIVVFEKLLLVQPGNLGTIEVANHEDINDEAQTVTVEKLRLDTVATGMDDKLDEKEVAGANAEMIDTVVYYGLVPGRQYTFKGVLMDQETATELLVDGQPVTLETTFTPTASNGTIVMHYSFDATTLVGKTIVVFVKLFDDENIEVAAHEDINDWLQTMYVVNP